MLLRKLGPQLLLHLDHRRGILGTFVKTQKVSINFTWRYRARLLLCSRNVGALLGRQCSCQVAAEGRCWRPILGPQRGATWLKWREAWGSATSRGDDRECPGGAASDVVCGAAGAPSLALLLPHSAAAPRGSSRRGRDWRATALPEARRAPRQGRRSGSQDLISVRAVMW